MNIERLSKSLHRRLSAWLAPVYGALGVAAGTYEAQDPGIDIHTIAPGSGFTDGLFVAVVVPVLVKLPVWISQSVEALARKYDSDGDGEVSAGEALEAVDDLRDQFLGRA